MDYAKKKKLINSAIYIGLALVITVVMCITIATFVSANRKSNTPPVTNPPITTQAPPVGNQTEPVTEPAVVDPETEPVDVPPVTEQSVGEVPLTFVLPANGYVQKDYSVDVPVFSQTMNDYRAHTGIDISVPVGSPVFAVTAGTIVSITDHPFDGTVVVIEHGQGVTSVYKNMSATLPSNIKAGAKVTSGQVIGAVGDTTLIELADADHLHFELKVNGNYVDPTQYIDFSSQKKSDNPGNE